MAEMLAEENVEASTDSTLALLSEDLGKDGYQRVLDANHVATYVARGRTLLVTFEDLRPKPLALEMPPIGLDFADDKGWSLLHIGTRKDTWFRTSSVYRFFDNLIDDAFFEEFDHVAFYGAGFGGYAACAYSVAAPGANILAISPQASLDINRAGWDRRFPWSRRIDFKSRYGYAPEMSEAAQNLFLMYDPYVSLDYVHASLFHGAHVQHLPCRGFGSRFAEKLQEAGLLHVALQAVAKGEFDRSHFYKELRKLRRTSNYARNVATASLRRGNPVHSAAVSMHALSVMGSDPLLEHCLERAKEMIAQRGGLPQWLKQDDPQ